MTLPEPLMLPELCESYAVGCATSIPHAHKDGTPLYAYGTK